MYPIYQFEVTPVGSEQLTRVMKPIYDGSLGIDWSIESNEQYYRSQLSGKLKFVDVDYTWLNARAFETEFRLTIYISRNGGVSRTSYWTGYFYKTDCEWDDDNKTVTVTPKVYDSYTKVLAGMENEYDLIKLAPAINEIKIDKRPMIQIYSPGESVVACFLRGMYWEQDAEETAESALNGKYFGLLASRRVVKASGCDIEAVNGLYHGDYVASLSNPYSYTKDAYRFKYVATYVGGSVPQWKQRWSIVRVSDSVEMWYYQTTNNSLQDVSTVTLAAISGTGATGTVTADLSVKKVYGRIVTDVTMYGGTRATSPLPSDDIVEDNRNYTRCLMMEGITGMITFYSGFTSTPTQYGIYQPGQYYEAPSAVGAEYYPVAKSSWDQMSIWYTETAVPITEEAYGRMEYTLKDAYPIESVISVLLNEMGAGVTHAGTSEYSQFLYGTNPQSNTQWKLHITPKSNILAGNYDQPAQKAPITLRQVLDMLRDCFRCYWYIENGKLKIENIQYFLKGKSYNTNPVVGLDLTTAIEPKTGKAWSFATSQYSFEKVEMPERYEFGWMDDVTEFFEGYPIEINSGFVEKGEIETINITNFTSDVDYMLLNPSACDEDGFALLAPVYENAEYKLPYVTVIRNAVAHVLQNGYMAFYSLQQYYMYDMPARSISADCVQTSVRGVKKQKTQEITFPLVGEVDLYKLIKTALGSGRIQKISITLPSRKAKATLEYDTV